MHLILSSNFSFYPQRPQSVLNKTNQHISKVFLDVLISYYSWGLRDPSPAPGWVLAPSWAPLIVSPSICLKVSFSVQVCFPFETSEALVCSLSGMDVFFECLSTRKPICYSTTLPLCAATPVHKQRLWLGLGKTFLSVNLWQINYSSIFISLIYSPFMLFVGLQDSSVCKGLLISNATSCLMQGQLSAQHPPTTDHFEVSASTLTKGAQGLLFGATKIYQCLSWTGKLKMDPVV